MKRFILNDGMFIDGSEYWFLSAERSELFCWNRMDNVVRLIGQVPDSCNRWRWYSVCVKVNNKVYCMPNNGNTIWVFYISNNSWKKVFTESDNSINSLYLMYWTDGQVLRLYSLNFKKVVCVDINNDCVLSEDFIHSEDKEFFDEELGNICKTDHGLYIPSITNSVVYKIDNDLNIIKKMIIAETDKGNSTCLDDGNNLWLSGFYKKLIRLNKYNDSVTYYDLPEEFGLYRYWDTFDLDDRNLDYSIDTKFDESRYPLFTCCLKVCDKIWFVPMFSNLLIYIDLFTDELNTLNFEEEYETRGSVCNRIINGKYIFEYVREDRYIGLFSIKNEWIIEIDAERMTYNVIEYRLEKNSYEYLRKFAVDSSSIVKENSEQGMQYLIDVCKKPKRKFYYDIKSLDCR